MKYQNKKTKLDGITFDSKLEAARYAELKLLVKAGKISGLVLQPAFELIPAFKKNGKTYRRTMYKADFMYTDLETGKEVVEDTKGVVTQVYALKRKLFEYRYPELTIREIKGAK